ncbi:MAG: glycosyltransferase [Pseudomonadota bacterium]
MIGAVVIGRNEGERLIRCLASLDAVDQIVYVDSGSTDGSVGEAEKAGAAVVILDPDLPFTAARARNAGLERLRELAPVELVQFVDGDCELQPDWIKTASTFLGENPKVAIACGRRRERFPQASIYNQLCDLEWDTPIGRADACGGDALMRVASLVNVGGYRDDLIAGEEPELCVRLRAAGWRVWRLDAEMTLHDADMHRFGQWWRRTARCGHAWAEGAALHGAPPERHCVPGVRRALIWGLGLPVVTAVLVLALGPWGLAALLAYPAQIVRIALREGPGDQFSWSFAGAMVLGKFAELSGILRYARRYAGGGRSGIIEYK